MTQKTRATKKRSTVTVPKLKAKAQTLLQKLVRMRAADSEGMAVCVTCKKRQSWKEMDGGHFISRRYTFHTLREENIHPQCKGCNGFLSGNMVAYTLYMRDAFGMDYVEWLEQTKNTVTKFTRPELLYLIEELKEAIKDQEVRLGI